MTRPLSEQICDLSSGEALARLQEKNRVLVEERLSKVDVEAQFSEEIAKREETAGFWQEFVEEPLDEAGQEFIEAFGGDEKSVAEAKANLESLIHSFFDPESLLANLSAGILPPDVVSLDRFFGDAAFPASIIERVPNLGGAKNAFAPEPCQRGVVQSTLSTVGRVAAGAVGNAARAVKTIETSIGFLKEKFEELGPALMDMPVQNLLAVVGSQDIVIDQIISVTREIIETVDGMDADDYPADHIALVRREQSRLRQADNQLAALEARLFAGADFSQPLWDSARDNVRDASKALCGFDVDQLIGGLTLKPFKLIGLVTYLETLCAILRRTQKQRERVQGFLADFEDQFIETARFDNLFVPIIDQIRCRVRKILEDMDATVAKNQFIRYLIKEKQWCLELLAIKAAMDFSNKIDLPDAVNKFTGTKAIMDAAEAVVDFTRDLNQQANEQSVNQLLLICESFTRNVRTKATRNVPFVAIVAEGEQLIKQAELCRVEGSFFGGLLNGLGGEIATYAGAAITAIQVIMEFAEERNLSSFTEAIAEGNLTEAFGIDALTATIEGQLTQLVACIVALSREGGGNPIAEAELLIVNEVFQDDARSLGLLDRLLHDYADAHVEEQLEVQAAKLKENEARIQRAAAALGETVDSTTAQFIPAKQAKEQKLKAAASGS